MHLFKAIAAAFAITLFAPLAAHANLIVDINDNGGYAEFSLSGTDTVISGSSGVNGLWVYGTEVLSMLGNDNTWTTCSANISGGGAELTNTRYGSRAVNDVCIDASRSRIGIRNGNGGVLATGDTFSMSGTFLTTIDYGRFVAGTYFFDKLTAYSSGGSVFGGGITYRVGPVQSVAEPGALALFGFGVVAMGVARRRRAA